MSVSKNIRMTVVISLSCLLFVSLSSGQESKSVVKQDEAAHENKTDEPKSQTVCPLTGGDINKKAYVDYKGQRIYLCCMGCEARFLKNPEKALQKIKEKGEMAETLDPVSVQPICPVSSDAIDPAIYVDHEGKRIYFCCEKCQKKFNKKPEKFLKIE